MNPELPRNPREELELRLTALLLGELSDSEAAAVRAAIAKDPELTRLHDDLKQTIRLVRVAATSPDEPAPAETPHLKLSEERRKKLLTAFVIPPLKASDRKPKPVFRTRLIEVLVVLALIAILASLAVPNFVKSRTTSQSNAVINNLRQLDGAKQQWALEQAKSAEDVPTMKDLAPYLKGVSPVMGETYALGKVGDSVSAETKSGLGRRRFSLPQSGQPLPASANLQGDLSASGALAYVPKDEVHTVTLGGANDYAGKVTLSAGSSPADGLPDTAFALTPVTPLPRSPANVYSLGVVGYVNSTGKNPDAKPVASVAGKPSQVYLPPTEAAPRASESLGEPSVLSTEGGGDGLAPLQLQLPAPTLKGTPMDLPRSSSIELAENTRQPDVLHASGSGGGGRLRYVAKTRDTTTAKAPDSEPAEDFKYFLDLNRNPIDPTTGLPVASPTPTPGTPEVAAVQERLGQLEFSPRDDSGAVLRGTARSYGALAANGDTLARRGAVAGQTAPTLGDAPTLRAFYDDNAGRDGADKKLGEGYFAKSSAASPAPSHDFGFRTTNAGALAFGDGDGRFGVRPNEPKPNSYDLFLADGAVPAGQIERSLGGERKTKVTNMFAGIPGYGYATPQEQFQPGTLVEERNKAEIVLPGALPEDAKSRGLTKTGTGVLAGDALVQEGKQFLAAGNFAEAEGRLKDALKADPKNRAAGYNMNVGQFRGGETDRQREQGLANKITRERRELDELRKGQMISDADAAGVAPTPILEADIVRRILSTQIEKKTQLIGREKLLRELKSLSREEIEQVLPRTVSDPTLTDLIAQRTEAEKRLVTLKNENGSNPAEVIRTQKLADDLKQRIETSITGTMTALETQMASARAEVAQLDQTLENAKKTDIEKAEKSRSYFDKKRELENLLGFRRILEMKIASEKIDVELPKTTMVEITDRATTPPEKQPSFFGRLTGKTTSTAVARVKVDRNASDIQGFTERPGVATYDPYFVQTEFEVIQSEAVLGKVVDQLKLDQAWAKGHGGGDKLKKEDAIKLLKAKLDLKPVRNTSFVEIRAKSEIPEEAAKLANAVAEEYQAYRKQQQLRLTAGGIKALENRYSEQEEKIRRVQQELESLREQLSVSEADASGKTPAVEIDAPPIRKPSTNAPIPQPEIQTGENNFSTFSLNVSDVSFKLAAASLEKGQMPDPASVRSEEFINAFDYRDPEPSVPLLGGVRGGFTPIAFAWERARDPFAHNRDLLRFSLKTAAAGRQAGRPLNIVLLLDNSGSMERADRVQIIREALRVLASQLQPQDKLSVITFARTPRLVADGVSGDKAGELAEQVSSLTPQGGTNLEDAMNLAYQTALRHYLANGINRVVVLTDGAANLGNVEPESLKQKVEAHRKQGIALDCFGIGWEGFNDDLLEVLSRNGDGRYGFINSPEEAATEFAGQLAGALKVAASDVKVQVEFNPKRVTAYRQIGYAKHQLTKEQFRDNTVDAAEIAAQEAGNALYTVEVNPAGEGPLGTVRVRFKIPGTTDYREQAWDVPFTGNALSLEQSSPAMRLAASASAFSEWLVASPFAGEVTPDRLLGCLSGVPGVYGADSRPTKLEWMIRQAKSIEGK